MSLKPIFLLAVITPLALAACNRQQEQAPAPVDTPMSSAPEAAPEPSADASTDTAATMPADPMADRSAGQALDDGVITTKVKSSLLADDQVKGMQIDVDTRNGEVTLSGQADTQAQADRAQELARAVEGVRSVNNQLSVRPNA